VASWWRSRWSKKSFGFALRVDATLGGHSKSATLVGPAQADAAASGASETVRWFAQGKNIETGAWMPEQIIDPGLFFSRLALHGLRVALPGDSPA
jgi:hypothetical protein